MFLSFLFQLSLQHITANVFSTSNARIPAHGSATHELSHNGEKSSGDRPDINAFMSLCIYFICMKPETSPKKTRRFFRNFCLFGRSRVLERLFELVRLWKASASLDFTVGFCSFSSNSWTSLCRGRRDENT